MEHSAMNEHWRRPIEYSENRRILLARMDKAFGIYSQEAEKLSVLLAATTDPSSWTSYHEILKQRTAEAVAYEQYSKLKDELFTHIQPPGVQQRRESSVS
jgi:hypothetical protein